MKDKLERLGSTGDIQEIKQHPWLCDEDWDEILQRKKKPPFVPKTHGKKWKLNFAEFAQEPKSPKLLQDSDLVKEYGELFDDFFYQRTDSGFFDE